MVFKVSISAVAKDTIGRYFEDYRDCQYGNDLQIRAFNYSLMRSALAHIDAFFDDVYTENGKKYIDIEKVATIEFTMEDNQTEVLVKNIYFKN